MAKNFNPRTAESLFKQKLRTMIGSTAHTQNIADQAMELAGQFMTEDEISNSDAYRVIENVSCVRGSDAGAGRRTAERDTPS